MRVPTIYFQLNKIIGEHLEVTGEDVHHLSRVLRMELNDQVRVKTFTNTYNTVIKKKFKGKIILKIISQGSINPFHSGPIISLYLSLIKPRNLVSIIQKITELGVQHFYPIETERSSIRKRDFNLKRFEKIAISSLKQSNRCFPLHVNSPIKIDELINYQKEFLAEETFNFLAYENETRKKITINKKKINIFIGPEGGINLREKMFLEEKLNFKSISLSANVLRVETAVLFALAKIL